MRILQVLIVPTPDHAHGIPIVPIFAFILYNSTFSSSFPLSLLVLRVLIADNVDVALPSNALCIVSQALRSRHLLPYHAAVAKLLHTAADLHASDLTMGALDCLR